MEPGKLILKKSNEFYNFSLNGPLDTRRARPTMKNEKSLRLALGTATLVIKWDWHRNRKID